MGGLNMRSPFRSPTVTVWVTEPAATLATKAEAARIMIVGKYIMTLVRRMNGSIEVL